MREKRKRGRRREGEGGRGREGGKEREREREKRVLKFGETSLKFREVMMILHCIVQCVQSNRRFSSSTIK